MYLLTPRRVKFTKHGHVTTKGLLIESNGEGQGGSDDGRTRCLVRGVVSGAKCSSTPQMIGTMLSIGLDSVRVMIRITSCD